MVTAEKMPGLAEMKPSNSAEVDGVHLDHSPMKKSKKNYLVKVNRHAELIAA